MRDVFATVVSAVIAFSVFWTDGHAEEIDRNRPKADPISELCLHPWKGDFRKPADADMLADEVYFPNASGARLRGWLFEVRDARQSILFCMGNAGNISLMLPYAKILQDAGFEVLLFDYQGFGNSEGTAGISSLLTDSLAAFDFLVNSRGRKPQDIGVFGVSLGSVLALTVAAERHAGAVAVEDAFIPDEQIDNMSRRYVRKDNTMAQFALTSVKALLLGRVAPLRNVARLKSPVFLMHGVNYRLLPPSGTLRIANACVGPKRVWLMESTGHAPESLEVNDLEYASQLQSFSTDAFSNALFEPQVTLKSVEANGELYSATLEVRSSIGDDSASSASKTGDRKLPIQIVLADDSGNFHFENRYLAGTEFRFQLPFRPSHCYAVRPHHIEELPGMQWRPRLSEYSQALGRFRESAHRVFRDEEHCEYFCSWEGMTFYNSAWMLPKLTKEKADEAMKALPAADSLPERVRSRYACLLARLHCWPQGKRTADFQHQFGEIMLQYLPTKPDEYYELGNARFQLMFRDSVVGDTLFRLARSRLSVGQVEEAKGLLRLHVSVLPSHVPTNLTEERISAMNKLDDLVSE